MTNDALFRLLLIEDNPADVEIVRTLLAEVCKPRFSISVAITLEDGLQRAKREHFDVGLLDLGLPDASGLDGLKRFLEERPDLPIVVLTVLDDDEIGEQAVFEGAEDFFAKQRFDQVLLPRALMHAIERARHRANAVALERQLLHANRLASIGQLAAGVAHEVNNPASFIINNVANLERDLSQLDEFHKAVRLELGGDGAAIFDVVARRFDLDRLLAEARTSVKDSDAGIQRIARIVRELGAFSRIEHDDAEWVDPNDLIAAACRLTQHEIRHNAQLVTTLGTVPLIAGHRGRLCQVLINLLLNAAQSIPQGAPEKNRIEVTSLVEDGCVILRVEDTGAGIAPDVLPRLFEPFFTTKRENEGTGLGLALSLDVIKKHRGRIEVESRPARGSRFDVILPLDTGLVPSRVDVQPKPVPERVPRGRILLVEDENMLRRSIELSLSRLHEVVAVEHGKRAIEVLDSDRDFDVVVCDLMMPQGDGQILYEYLEKAAPEILERFVFLTGGAITRRMKSFLERIHGTVLKKPIAPAEFFDLIARYVAQRRTASSASQPVERPIASKNVT